MSADAKARGQTRAVTSLQNDRIKFIRSLEMRKARRETSQFVAEGASVLISARDASWKPETLVFLAGHADTGVARDLLFWAERAGAECLEVSKTVLAKVAAKDNPQTLLGVFTQRWAEEPTPSSVASDAVWVALEGVRDPGNLGTIIRTVEAAGAEGVMLIGACCDPYSREAVRATMGSIFNVPLVRLAQDRFLAFASAWPGEIIGTELSAAGDFRAMRYRRPTLLVMGSEGPGLSAPLAKACTRLVKIPMAGKLDSLNLAVATALMLYEIRRDDLRDG
jgi:TrmH family RNA methyltransferase